MITQRSIMKTTKHIGKSKHPISHLKHVELLFAASCLMLTGCAGGQSRGRPDGGVAHDAWNGLDAAPEQDGEIACNAVSCPTGCCDEEGECRNGIHDNICGIMGEACKDCSANGLYCSDGECVAMGECEPGETLACGNCGFRTCRIDNTWGPCENTGECSPGATDIVGVCGNCGKLQRTCSETCTWGSTACVDQGECSPGAIEQGGVCGQCAVEQRTCNPETCHWSEWECVGHSECNPGETESSDTPCGNCGHERRTCDSNCMWSDWTCANEGECTPGSHSVLGCEPCGSKTCNSSCEWGPCVIPIDVDYISTNYTVLSGYNSTCNGTSERWGINCAAAVHSFCRSQNCPESGFGPVENAGNNLNAFCISGGAESIPTTYSILSTHHSGCNGTSQQMGPDCNAAIHRYCISQGYISGFGPVALSGNNPTITCVSIGEVRSVAFSTLAGHHEPCDGTNERNGPNCSAAINRYCQSLGRTSGFGPVENTPETAYVVCIQP